MQLPLEIDYRNVPSSVPIDVLIRTRVAKLSRCHPRLIGCHVIVEKPHQHRQHGNAYQVHIRLVVPGSVVAVSHDRPDAAGQDLYASIRDAFDAAERQLSRLNHRIHRLSQAHELEGTA